ncbi:MFS transporter [Saccharibacillus sp. CPCC 101409]|uniref:MFS transporter n=1 Tax=Saccharibacillus sp. CPCC 101409 TaxID=3058041 RepID=UPI0026737E16|nr:MFS transporter [Saccharibacillus sp. CPCC 101409]MDO3410090.1 MFS transporter [Saccharibacillus sp. CPCC 101409]
MPASIEAPRAPASGRPALLKNRVFARMFAAYSLAVLGDWFDAIAVQVLIVYRWGASPMQIALVPVCMAVPGILLGTAAGMAADRFDRLKLMRICDLLTAFVTLLILLAPGIYWLLPLLALRAALGVFNMPAQQAQTRRVVREDQLLEATSLNGLVGQLSRIAGPLLGAAVLAAFSPQACLLLNAAARFASYGLLRSIRAAADAAALAAGRSVRPEAAAEAAGEERPGFARLLREGWTFVRGSRPLLSTLLFSLAGMLVIQLVDYQFVGLFRFLAPESEGAIGWLLAASGLSAIAALFALNRAPLLKKAGYGVKIGIGYALIGLSIGWLGLLPAGTGPGAILAAGLLLGFGNGLVMITLNYGLQKETPPRMTGRVFGIQNTLLSAVMIAAPLLGGLLVERFGPGPVFGLAGLFVLLLGLAGLGFGRLLWPRPPESEH